MNFKLYYIKGKIKRNIISITKYIFGYALIFFCGYILKTALEDLIENSVFQFLLNPLGLNIPLTNQLFKTTYIALIIFVLCVFILLFLGRKVRSLIKLPIWIINLPLYWISSLITKEKKLWLFGCRQGKVYAENPKYLFEYISKSCPDIRAIWITKNREVYKKLKAKNKDVCMAYSVKGYYYSMKAEAIFISHQQRINSDYNDYASSHNTFIFQLWHGSPMKGLGLTSQIRGKSRFNFFLKSLSKKAANITFPFLKNRSSCHKMLSASPLVSEALKESYLLKNTNVLVAGYPKNDPWLLRAKTNINYNKNTNVIYMPTWRKNDWELFVNYKFDLDRLNRFCQENSMIFNIKLHPYSIKRIDNMVNEFEKFPNIKYCSVEDIYEIIDSFDILVTDYSSIIFDFILSDRPIIYTPFDYDHYFKNDVGFLYAFDEVCAGPIAHNWLELEKYLLSDLSVYTEKRMELKNRFNTFLDMNSCERIVQFMKSDLSAKMVERANWNL